ncbi:uncharacterized protein LOC117089702 isoform X2 [Trachypithecus francoisi]|uniref:uncharacterized protein LOC117089702 isoform X2 n=1 Tax=Trachypithecus francoisi TaxID=54180 RepID=UPI00141BC8F9|nr:uncharacterized protein LOC117089702 isoform X2 [Trachypithecus francoisi]
MLGSAMHPAQSPVFGWAGGHWMCSGGDSGSSHAPAPCVGRGSEGMDCCILDFVLGPGSHLEMERFDAAGYYQLALAAAVDLGNKKGTAEDLHAAGHHLPQLPPGPREVALLLPEGQDLRHSAQCLQGQPASSATLRVGPLIGPSHPR